MADINKLKDKIKSTIYPNGKGAINASDHQAMLLDMADGMAETDTKLATLSAETKDKLLEVSGLAEFNFPSSSNGWHYYTMPFLKRGYIYSFTITLGQVSQNPVYWNIKGDGEDVFESRGIYAGELTKSYSCQIEKEYLSLQLAVYSGVEIPQFSFVIESSESIIGAIEDSISELSKREVGTLYKKAWVRYSDGLIGDTSGGAMAYIIRRTEIPSATKVFAKVCTEQTTFAAIAFYSTEEPSTSSYIKDASVEGVTSNFSENFEALIPSDCKSIIVMNMSQLQTDYEIKVDENPYERKIADVAKLALSNQEQISDMLTRNVGTLYKKAWVRYSDGLIGDTSGGAMAYIIRRTEIPSATKVFAKVCTEQTTFAAIAFYSTEEPSTSSYIKDASVEGVTSNFSENFEALIPSDCKSIIVMNMSQLQTDYEIKVDEPIFVTKKEIGILGADAKPLFNPFIIKNQYYHFNQEDASDNTFIPAQSLFDVAFAARLGFEMIEANAQPCSDGIFICKHGTSGKFGNGIKSDNGVDYSSVAINSVTSNEVREHITYDSRIQKYNVPIPTLDEFCSECKKHNMSIKVNNVSGLLPILRKYFTDDKIFISGLQARGDFKGLVEVVYYPSNGMADLDAKCQKVGYPLQIIIASGQFENMSDDAVKEVVNYAHQHSYTVAVAYLTTSNWLRAQSLGVDVNLSCYRTINSLETGNDKNVSVLNDSKITFADGARYNEENDTIVMTQGSSLSILADNILFGAVGVDVCHLGTITLQFGHSQGISNAIINGDGKSTSSLSQAIMPVKGEEKASYYLKLTADTDSEIKTLNIRCSKL